jgi:hypothetical protein
MVEMNFSNVFAIDYDVNNAKEEQNNRINSYFINIDKDRNLLNKSVENRIVNHNGNSYYAAGVLFMISVIGLLLYVNLYQENCFTESCMKLSNWRGFSFLKFFFRIKKRKTNQSKINEQSSNNQVESKDLIEEI